MTFPTAPFNIALLNTTSYYSTTQPTPALNRENCSLCNNSFCWTDQQFQEYLYYVQVRLQLHGDLYYIIVGLQIQLHFSISRTDYCQIQKKKYYQKQNEKIKKIFESNNYYFLNEIPLMKLLKLKFQERKYSQIKLNTMRIFNNA